MLRVLSTQLHTQPLHPWLLLLLLLVSVGTCHPLPPCPWASPTRRQGTCTACCAKVLSGRVSQPKQRCIPAQLVKQGYVALCCATPSSDVKIQTHQGPAIKRWKAEHSD